MITQPTFDETVVDISKVRQTAYIVVQEDSGNESPTRSLRLLAVLEPTCAEKRFPSQEQFLIHRAIPVLNCLRQCDLGHSGIATQHGANCTKN